MGNPKVKPRFWIIVALLFLLVCITIHLIAVISPNWYEVQCQNGTLSLGLWQYCGDPVEIVMANTSNGHANPAIIDVFGYKQESETCITLGNYLFIGKKGNSGIIIMLLGVHLIC